MGDNIEQKPIIGDEYYIPSIEEFHIGFEYELYQHGKWNKYKLSVDDTFYHTRIKFPIHFMEFIRLGECRRLKSDKCSFCNK